MELGLYMDQCRTVFRANFDVVRAGKREGTASAMQVVIQNSFGSASMEADELFGVPAELCKIYGFGQIGVPNDLNLSSHTRTKKVWRTIKNYRDKFLPGFKDEGVAMSEAITKYQDTTPLSRILYLSNFVFKPSEALM